MIKDRGNIKWQGMMLTEHVNMLKEWKRESGMVERPELDEWEQNLIAEEIERAYKSRTTIKLTFWRDGYLKNDHGKVIEVNNQSKSIVIDDPFSTIRYSFNEIIAVSLIE